MIASGSAVPVKGLGLSLVSARKGLMAPREIDDAFKDAALEPLLGNRPLTALSQETDVGFDARTSRRCGEIWWQS
jgi:hypothetical protein